MALARGEYQSKEIKDNNTLKIVSRGNKKAPAQ